MDVLVSRRGFDRTDNNGWQYILTIPFQTQEDLDETIYEILREAQSTADARHCFIEADVKALDGFDIGW